MVLLGATFTFVLGESLAGAFFVVNTVYRIGTRIREVDIFDPHQIDVLKDLGNWCLLIATSRGVVAALAFPGFFFAPWNGSVPLVSLIVEFGIFFTIPVLMALVVSPLLGLHKTLLASKRKELDKIYKHYRNAHRRLTTAIDGGDPNNVDKESKDLEATFTSISVAFTMIRSIPDWPWDPAIFQTLIASLLASVLSYLIVTII